MRRTAIHFAQLKWMKSKTNTLGWGKEILFFFQKAKDRGRSADEKVDAYQERWILINWQRRRKKRWAVASAGRYSIRREERRTAGVEVKGANWISQSRLRGSAQSPSYKPSKFVFALTTYVWVESEEEKEEKALPIPHVQTDVCLECCAEFPKQNFLFCSVNLNGWT